MAGLGGYEIGPREGDRARADSWPVLFVIRETEPGHDRGAGVAQAHLVCTSCAQSVICLSPDAGSAAAGYVSAGYLVSPGEIAARTLAHIRQCHDAPPAPGV
jgi:hypothetical protein